MCLEGERSGERGCLWVEMGCEETKIFFSQGTFDIFMRMFVRCNFVSLSSLLKIRGFGFGQTVETECSSNSKHGRLPTAGDPCEN